MDFKLIKDIFEQKKYDLLKGIKTNENPIALILGGQPASGKSSLAKIYTTKHSDENFLFVNGDLYREFHPNYKELIKDSENYSKETQMFSNVFTEELIKEAQKNKFNIIVEGTMRNPKIPLTTALEFKHNGFKVEAMVISAPAIFTELGVYARYQEEINFQGTGRLADMNSHNDAVNGLLISVDELFINKAVDKLGIYTYQGKEEVKCFTLNNNNWTPNKLPSNFILESRKQQLENTEQINRLINRGIKTLHEMNPILQSKVTGVLRRLDDILLEINRENKRGFRR